MILKLSTIRLSGKRGRSLPEENIIYKFSDIGQRSPQAGRLVYLQINKRIPADRPAVRGELGFSSEKQFFKMGGFPPDDLVFAWQ